MTSEAVSGVTVWLADTVAVGSSKVVIRLVGDAKVIAILAVASTIGV